MKIKAFIRGINEDEILPVTEMDLSNTNWNEEETKKIDERYELIKNNRIFKLAGKKLNIDKKIEDLRNICFQLEKEGKKYM